MPACPIQNQARTEATRLRRRVELRADVLPARGRKLEARQPGSARQIPLTRPPQRWAASALGGAAGGAAACCGSDVNPSAAMLIIMRESLAISSEY